jgi:hypothetical protein
MGSEIYFKENTNEAKVSWFGSKGWDDGTTIRCWCLLNDATMGYGLKAYSSVIVLGTCGVHNRGKLTF